MRDETIKTILEYEINQSSVNRAVATAQRVEASQRDLSGVLGRYGAVARASVIEANAAFDSSRRELEFVRDAVERLNAEIDDVPASAQRAERALDQMSSSGRGAGGGQAVARGGSVAETVDRVGSFSSQVFSGLGASDLANSAGLVGDVAGGIAVGLNPALIAATAAAGGLALVMAELNRRLEEARERTQRYVERELEINELIQRGATSADLGAAAEEIRIGFQATTETIAQLSELEAEFNALRLEAFGTGRLGELNAQLQLYAELQRLTFGQITNFRDLAAEIERLTEQTKELKAQYQQTGAALEDPRVRINDLRETVTRLGGVTEQTGNVITSIFGNAVEGIRDDVVEFSAASAAAAQRWADAVKAAQDARRIAEAEFRAAQQQAATDSLKAAQQGIGSAANAIARAEQALADSERRASQRQQDIGGQRDEAIARIEADAGQERIRRAEETAERLRQIERDYGRDRLRAIADRDAVAAVTADEARADQLDDQRSADARAEREAQRNRDRQLAQARESADRQLLLARSAATEDLMIRRRAVEEAQSEERAARAALLMTQRNYNAQFVQEAATAGRLAADAWKSALAGLSSGRAGSLTVSSLTGMAGTGRAQTFTINVNGATQRQITATSKQQAMQVFEDILRSSGVR